MDLPRLHIPPSLQRRMAYPKFRDAAPRMFVLRGEYWLDVACIRAATALGWAVAEVPVRFEGSMSRQALADLFTRLAEFKPDFILSVNMGGMDEQGLMARFFADLAIPYVVWFVDDPRTILMDRTWYSSETALAFTWERAYLPYLERCGFAQVSYLPLAVDDTLFSGAPEVSPDLPPAFIANSMAGKTWLEWQTLCERHSELARALSDAFAEGRVTRDAFGQGMHAIIGPQPLQAATAEGRRQTELVAFMDGTRRLRQEFVESLHGLDVLVCGDEAWRSCAEQWRPYIHYERELASAYRRCRINLNRTSIQMPTAVNQRVFDCPMAGGFLLTDAQADLEQWFQPDREIVTFATHEEARDKILFYENHPHLRTQIVQNAQIIIAQHHTYRHRLQTLQNHLLPLFS